MEGAEEQEESEAEGAVFDELDKTNTINQVTNVSQRSQHFKLNAQANENVIKNLLSNSASEKDSVKNLPDDPKQVKKKSLTLPTLTATGGETILADGTADECDLTVVP